MVYHKPVFKNDYAVYNYYTSHEDFIVDENGLQTAEDFRYILKELLHYDPARRPDAECIIEMFQILPPSTYQGVDSQGNLTQSVSEIIEHGKGIERNWWNDHGKTHGSKGGMEKVKRRRWSCQCINVAFRWTKKRKA